MRTQTIKLSGAAGTMSDEQNPTTTLIGKKVGRNISAGQTVTLQVRNSDGTLSNQFNFTR